MKVKAVLFGVVTVITAGLVFFTTKSKAATPDEPKPPTPPPGPPPAPPVSPPSDCVNGVKPGVTMLLTTAQAALNKAGANPQIIVDGKYGDRTKNALSEFQWVHKLANTGCVDAATAKALQPYVTASGPFYEKFRDSNGMYWEITRPTMTVWRAQQLRIDTTGNGDWQSPYPDYADTMERPTYNVLIDSIQGIASGYTV